MSECTQMLAHIHTYKTNTTALSHCLCNTSTLPSVLHTERRSVCKHWNTKVSLTDFKWRDFKAVRSKWRCSVQDQNLQAKEIRSLFCSEIVCLQSADLDPRHFTSMDIKPSPFFGVIRTSWVVLTEELEKKRWGEVSLEDKYTQVISANESDLNCLPMH